VDKRYRIQVRGDLRPRGTSGRIEQALDGKAAVTEWFLEHYDVAAHVSTVQVRMLSGRYHQIRRHFAGIGCPVMGDPRYGQGNKNEDGLKLAAVGIAFKDPWTGDAMCFGECSAL
jgi:tRNA pseudouridine32 synthase/23S rRNA pseudouridine746 synthase